MCCNYLNMTFAVGDSSDRNLADRAMDDSAQTTTMPWHSYVILVMTCSVIVSNALTVAVFVTTTVMDPTLVNRHFLLSMTMADLCLGVLVLPFSLWTSRYSAWTYSSWLCHAQAYLAAIFWIVSLYSLMWLSIDHMLAIRKMDRYESIMTDMKSKCWVAFVWMGSVFYCLPPLLGVATARYYPEAFICIADWRQQKAYLVASGALICIPPLITITTSNVYMFTSGFKENAVLFDKTDSLNSRPDAYIRNLVITVVYVISWSPWLCVELYELMFGEAEANLHPRVHFYCMWLAIGNSAWKFLVYVCFDQDFRSGLKLVYLKVCVCRCPWTVERNTLP